MYNINMRIARESLNRVLRNYRLKDIKDIDFKVLSIPALRDIATIMSYSKYMEEVYSELDYLTIDLVRQVLNAEFLRRIGPIWELYKFIDTQSNYYKQLGNESYKLLSYEYKKGCSELSALKTAVWLYKYIGQSLNMQNLVMMIKGFEHNLYWGFGFEDNIEKETEIQNAFIDCLLEGDYVKAYDKFIQDEAYQREELIKRRLR